MCKITCLPNPHIYWVVIFAEIYIILLGLIILVVGALNISQHNKLEGKLITDNSISITAILFGTVIILVGIAGIVLVILWKWQYLAFHGAVTLFVAAVLFLTGIFWLTTWNRETFTAELQDKLVTGFGGQEIIAQEGVASTLFTVIQRNLKCCGLHSWKDYRINYQKEFSIPTSCCKNCEEGDKLHFLKETDVNSDQIYQHGCLMKLLVYSSLTVSELRMYFIFGVFPLTQSGILLAILAHFIRYRYI